MRDLAYYYYVGKYGIRCGSDNVVSMVYHHCEPSLLANEYTFIEISKPNELLSILFFS